jgi:pilus assembly protein Flp/PilA
MQVDGLWGSAKGEAGMAMQLGWIWDFLKNEDGPTSVEYAIQLALIVALCVTSIGSLGGNVNKAFNSAGKAAGGAGS